MSNTYYYSLGDHLLGNLTTSPGSTAFFITDGLGSVLTTFSTIANSAALLGNQVYSPYGTQRYQKGSMGTTKGFTGQYNDSVSGLDYYNARYYDPVASVFLSADVAQGNISGMNPYDYVGGNPETWSDPSGQFVGSPADVGGGAQVDNGGPPSGMSGGASSDGGGGGFTGIPMGIQNSLQNSNLDPTIQVGNATWYSGDAQINLKITNPDGSFSVTSYSPDSPGYADAYRTYVGLAYLASLPSDIVYPRAVNSVLLHHSIVTPGGTGTGTALPGGSGAKPPGGGGGPRPAAGGDFCSFTTDHGKQSIATLHIGEKVQSYNPKTHKMELQPILHVWTHKDHDLVDLTITTTTKTQHGKPATLKREVVHTTSEHPFLTTEKGFVPAGKVQMGMHILKADGSVGVITVWKSVHGTKVMYNLEVAYDHTFTVGNGQWVVHNKCDRRQLRRNLGLRRGDPFQGQHIIPCELESAGAIGGLIQASGLNLNSAMNGRKLPSTPQGSLDELQPYHSSSHPDYTEYIRGLLEEHVNNLADSNGNFDSAQALNAVQEVIAEGNAYIDDLAGQVRLNAEPVRLC